MKRELKLALNAFAVAVRKTLDMYDIPGDETLRYHASEYSQEMTRMLLEQLLTATDNPTERNEILSNNGLEHLEEDLQILANEWESNNII